MKGQQKDKGANSASTEFQVPRGKFAEGKDGNKLPGWGNPCSVMPCLSFQITVVGILAPRKLANAVDQGLLLRVCQKTTGVTWN